jgi:hypothetical protein
MPRSPVYVESERVAYVDTGPTIAEPWGWRNSPAYTFAKALDWELMLPRRGDPVTRLPDFVCFELKWLDAEEFSHWSHTDFKVQINARKRREWELFHALRERSSLPENVILVESPDGTHVIDHLRRIYKALLRQYDRTTPIFRDLIEDKKVVSPPSVDGRRNEPELLAAQSVGSVTQPIQNEGISRE